MVPMEEGTQVINENTDTVLVHVKKRVCLRCRKEFLSTHAGHRICQKCHKNEPTHSQLPQETIRHGYMGDGRYHRTRKKPSLES